MGAQTWTGTDNGKFSHAANWLGGLPVDDGSAALQLPAIPRANYTTTVSAFLPPRQPGAGALAP